MTPPVAGSPSASFVTPAERTSNLPLGIIAGAVAAVIGAAAWAAITYATEMKIGYVAIGVGFIVGLAIRKFGNGSTPIYGVMGGVLALVGCFLGDVLTVAAFAAKQSDASIFQILAHLPPNIITVILRETSPIGWLIYVFAVMAGHKYSMVPSRA